MRLFCIIIILLSYIPGSFAQQCKVSAPSSTASIFSLAKNSLSTTCLIQREQYRCSELEAELPAEDKKKVIQCDPKSIEEQSLSNTSLTACVWNGLKLSGEQLVDLAKLPGQIAESVAKGFHETQLCNSSLEKKRELLTAFNLSIEDKRFKLSEQFLGKWLEDASCAEIDKLLWSRYQNYQNVLMRERIAAINEGRKPSQAGISENSGSDLLSLLKSVMSAAQVRYECYTPKVKAEMICAGVTSLIADTAMGMGIQSAVGKIAAIAKSKKALAGINRAIAAGEKVDLRHSGSLLNADRKRAAAAILNDNLAAGASRRVLTEAEEKALIRAHEVGLPDRGYFTYTREDLAEKARILKEAGFSVEERRLLMENGIVGEIKDPWMINAITTHFKKVLGQPQISAEKSAAIIKLESLGSTSSNAYKNGNPRLFLEQAGFSKEEIEAIINAKKAEEVRQAKGLPYKEPVAKPASSSPVKVATVPETVAPLVINHAEKAGKLGLKEALAEAEKLRLPRDAKGMRLKVNGKEVIAGPAELEASSEYLYRAAKLERETAEEAYRKRNRTLKADVDFINKHVEGALEASLRGDGTVAKKIIVDALSSPNNSMKNINEVLTHIYQHNFDFPNGTEAQKIASDLKKQNLKKVLDEIKANKGDALLTNGNNGVYRSMMGYVNSN